MSAHSNMPAEPTSIEQSVLDRIIQIWSGGSFEGEERILQVELLLAEPYTEAALVEEFAKEFGYDLSDKVEEREFARLPVPSGMIGTKYISYYEIITKWLIERKGAIKISLNSINPDYYWP